VAEKSNEITAFVALLEGLPLSDVVGYCGCDADTTGACPVPAPGQGRAFVFPVLENQPGLFA
jgi:hypothetical protein